MIERRDLPDLTLVLPTYNERENLAPLLERLSQVLRPYTYEIIIVDDDSSDGTWEEAERLRATYTGVRVVRRIGEKGLSSAVLRGFREARGRVLGVMDADLQHDETVLPQLIDDAADVHFVVASRAVEGGELGPWAVQRRFTSWVASTLARLVLDVSLSDPMSGFFSMPRELFARLDDGALRPEGFKILLYLYVQACLKLGRAHIRVREVGFTFRKRLHGESKLTSRVMRDYLRMLYDLRRSSPIPWGFIKFVCVGALGVVVNSSILLWVHQRIGVHYLLAGALAIEAAIAHNFALNELWTFRSRRSGRRSAAWGRLGKFHLASCGGLLINLALLALLHGIIGLPLLLSNLVGIGGGVVCNYAVNKLWTWQGGQATPDRLPSRAGRGPATAEAAGR